MPKKVEECVKSIMKDRDVSEEQAYKICNSMDNKGKLGGRVTHQRLLAGVDDKPVKRVEGDDDKVTYTNVMLLGPGVWTDAGSGQTIHYAPDAIKRSVDNWVDSRGEPVEKAQLNHSHDPHTPGENIGHVPVDSVYADAEGNMYGDIVFHRLTQRSKEMDRLMREALRTDGQEGLGGVSVEIPMDETEWDSERGLERMTEMWFSGVGVVMNPASETVAFGAQAERAVALSGAVFDRSHMFRADSTKSGANREGTMSKEDLPPALRDLRKLQETAEQAPTAVEPTPEGGQGEETTNEVDVALSALTEYLGLEENDETSPLTALVEWAQQNMDPEQAAMVDAAATSYIEATGTEMEEATVGDFRDWADGATEEEGTGTETAPGNGMPQEGMMEQYTEETVRTLTSVIEAQKETTKKLQARMDAERKELENQIETLEKRVKELEDEPVGPRTGFSESKDVEEEADDYVPMVEERGGYATR
jgi:hypothetical protein